jgi:hypothetical protein
MADVRMECVELTQNLSALSEKSWHPTDLSIIEYVGLLQG